MTKVIYPLTGKRVWVAGHTGMVGSALLRRLIAEDCEVITVGRAEVDLTRQSDVEDWMADATPDAVILAAATVGGILANASRPVEFLNQNLLIQTNILANAHKTGVQKLLFMGSSCIYPKAAPQPILENNLLAGPLEPTNQWYAIAKIAGVLQCQAYRKEYGKDFISCMPANLYGPGDNFNLEQSHVLPALLAKAHQAKTSGDRELTIWGSGKPRREFLYVDDLADACVFLMKSYSEPETINLGFGSDITIEELARIVSEVVGFEGNYLYDTSKPDGTKQKLLDSSRVNGMGWRAQTLLKDGIATTYAWYMENAT